MTQIQLQFVSRISCNCIFLRALVQTLLEGFCIWRAFRAATVSDSAGRSWRGTVTMRSVPDQAVTIESEAIRPDAHAAKQNAAISVPMTERR